MPDLDRSTAGLRFHEVDLEEVTRVLGVSPNAPAKRPDLWLYSVVAREPGDIDAQIVEMFASMTKDLAAWRSLTDHHRADVYCGAFFHGGNAGFSLSPVTLQLLAERGLELDLDIYGV